ncbi:hypothetical protein FOF52_16315 [Thermobifida alba]|uniref:Uncharacterized protein n=1 Tax=Thermobifida alba TaxID=53522 RepID=A0ABY4L3S3_THEAE|nr:hypothetical protein [Thermobifida alba]UPT22336.1 hypothetical protein FOF52_16315 [Thermobifida alba]HLU95726.1 hypothetical protein [Thermobifida alba]
MFDTIRATVKTVVLSLGAAGLVALGGGVAFAAVPTAENLTGPLGGLGISLPGEAAPADSLPGDLVDDRIVPMRAPVTEGEEKPTVSGDLTVLPEGKDTAQVLLDEIERRSAVHQERAGSLLGGAAPDVVPQRDAADPAETLGLSTEGLLGKGLLGEGLSL